MEVTGQGHGYCTATTFFWIWIFSSMGQFRSSLWSSSPPSLSHGPHHLSLAHFHFLPPSSPTYGPHDLSPPYFYSSSCSFCYSSSVYFASLSFFLLSSWLSPSSINTDFSNTVTLCFSSRIYASGRGGKSPSKVFREVGRAARGGLGQGGAEH